ncbi:hypothetical protein C7S14_8400 [Burkholderia cepacia]|nr:hypothetical protein [Burkholderia cepacia]QOH36644.1 hypothetical protein C7S14_8400 [Burkholderia cepacia]
MSSAAWEEFPAAQLSSIHCFRLFELDSHPAKQRTEYLDVAWFCCSKAA